MKGSKVVYDCLSSSPFYPVKEYYSNYNRITTDRRQYEEISHQEKAVLSERFFKSLPPFYNVSHDGEEDETLVFESRFESGNLRRAFQKDKYEYDLILKTDHNTSSYTQWFYFKVSNTRKGRSYKFNIINLVKPDSLYNQGMRILQYSVKNSMNNCEGWFRGGKDISYKANSFKKKQGGNYYTLSFTLSFQYSNDDIYISHCYPYTYTDLKYFLAKSISSKTLDRCR